MKNITLSIYFLFHFLSGFAQKDALQIYKPNVKQHHLSLDTVLITIPLFQNEQTTAALKEQALVRDEIREDFRTYFLALSIPHSSGEENRIEYYRRDDSTYFKRTYLGSKRIAEGKVVFVDTIIGDKDSLVITDPRTLKSQYSIVQRKSLWKTDYWDEVDSRGNLWSGHYQKGKRIGKWTYSSTDRLYTELAYKNGELIEAKTPDSLIIKLMKNNWLEKKWLWCQVLQAATEEGKVGKERWSLKLTSNENCQGFGWFIFRENSEFELIAGNGQSAIKTIEGIGKWYFEEPSTMTLRFSNQTELQFNVDVINSESFIIRMKL